MGSLLPVGVVLALSLGSGLAVFVGAGLLVWALHKTVLLALGAAGAAILVVWSVWIVQAGALFWATETVYQVGQGEGQPTRQRVSLELHEPTTGRWAFADLPGTPEALQEMARGLLLGRPFSEAEWTGSARPYSRAEFRELRSALLERGILAWRNPQAPPQGVTMTRPGRAVFERLSEMPDIARTHAHARNGGDVALLERPE